ncbi:uncharacterized protein LOC125836066 [Solanum verrucosum]|uniref:uncharacterized protein LOC125836066 n=1 Tax=Solanum verrucosum TaxID=315347 RepID=UPI0020D17868|nr:uncharacterized protein LOC125836066 [Solanum verrucosum]
MSVRLMKKILKEQEPPETQQLINSEDESESPPPSSGTFRNPFDLLDDEDDDDGGVDQENNADINDGSSIENGNEKQSSTKKTTPEAFVLSDSKFKKKKKKKNKEKSQPGAKDKGNSWNESLEQLSIEDDSCHLEHVAPDTGKYNLRNLNGRGKVVKQCTSSVLQVDPKFLNAENELRRIFGSKVVNSFEKGHQTGSSRQSRGGRRGSQNHRKTILVCPLEHWPKWDGSLSMELVETRDGISDFRYVHTSSYSQAQKAFESAKAVHDFNGIVNILLHHPYHVDSLITLAEYYKFSGEQQMSADCTARCLYALECAWHPMFTPLMGNCQLKFSCEINKPLFSVLFSHMKNMDRRGCHRSALELCKLLLLLDPDDPMGVLFCIDYYSLRAEEYTWLEQFSEQYKSDNSLWLFPNFSYSLAVCRYYVENDEHAKEIKAEDLKASSADLMKQALMLHPSVLKKLVSKVPLKDKAWTSIIKHNFFSSDQTGTPSLDHLINIYVERSYIIWRLPDLQKFLRDAALSVIETLQNDGTYARDWTCVRKEAFSSEKNEYSHLLVSDFSDSVQTLPPDNLQNFMVDPRGEVPNDAQPANHRLQDLTDRNAIAVLLESMLPWMNYGSGHDQPDHDEQGNEG